MGSYILRSVRPSNLQAYVLANAPGSIRATGRESYRSFLVTNGAVGNTLADLENSFLSGQPGQTLFDKWSAKNSAGSGSTTKEKTRSTFK